MGRLTAKRVERMQEPGRYSDGGTLFLDVSTHTTKTGERRIRKSWLQRLTIHGKRRDLGLGGYPLVGLSEARDAAFSNRQLARRGGDPMALLNATKTPTFGEAAAATLDAYRQGRAEATVRAWMPVLEAHAQAIWDLPVDKITRQQAVDAIKGATNSNRDKVKMRLSQVFGWCEGYGHIAASPLPTNGALQVCLGTKAKKATTGHAAMDWRKVPEFFAALPETAAGMCMRFLILAGPLRSSEARGVKRSDIQEDTLVIPAERMKSRREFRQPLTTAAQAVLDSVPRVEGADGLIFRSERTGRQLSDEGLRALVKAHGVTTHGFRAAFSTFAAEAKDASGRLLIDDETAVEHALHHLTGSAVSRAYCRSDYTDRRRAVLDVWSAFVLTGRTDPIEPIKHSKRASVRARV